MRFAFRICHHFGFSDRPDKDLRGYDAEFRCVDRRAVRLSRRPVAVKALMATRPSAVFPPLERSETNAPAEAPELPSPRRGSSPTSAPSRRHTRLYYFRYGIGETRAFGHDRLRGSIIYLYALKTRVGRCRIQRPLQSRPAAAVDVR